MNKHAIINYINMRDQAVFAAFEDIELKDSLKHAKMIKFSLQPNGVSVKDFDFNIHISKDNLGAESDQVKVAGFVTLKNKSVVPFSAKIPKVKVQYILGTKYDVEREMDRW